MLSEAKSRFCGRVVEYWSDGATWKRPQDFPTKKNKLEDWSGGEMEWWRNGVLE